MEHPVDVDRLKADEWQQLANIAALFRRAWQQAGSPAGTVDVAPFLPPPQHPLRALVLQELIAIDLESRWKLGQPVSLEYYLEQFPELGGARGMPVQLVHAEYCVRRACGDNPQIDGYRLRFPEQFRALSELLRPEPPQPAADPRAPPRAAWDTPPQGLSGPTQWQDTGLGAGSGPTFLTEAELRDLFAGADSEPGRTAAGPPSAQPRVVVPQPRPVHPPGPWLTRRNVALITVVLGLLAAAVGGLIWWQRRPGPPELGRLPPGYQEASQAKVVLINNHLFFSRIATIIQGHQVVFLLVRKTNRADPPSFYIMEDKVSNELFNLFANDQEGRKRLEEFRQKQPKLIKGQWRKGAVADGKDLGSGEDQLPAMRMTMLEAYAFARWLGGHLPSARQWDKAAGRFEDEPGLGPFRGPWNVRDRNTIAVNRVKEGPMPVGLATRDISQFGCRDMAGNGWEWTRNALDEQQPFASGFRLHPERTRVILRSQSYRKPRPLWFTDLAAHPDTLPYQEVKPDVGFRVVLEPSLDQ